MKYFRLSKLIFLFIFIAIYNNLSAEDKEIDSLIIDFESYRSLDEINTETSFNYNCGEGHPWISNDGLRLYFTQGDTDNRKIFLARRDNLTSEFSNINQLNINIEGSSNYSCWLTPDELNIFYVVSDEDDLLHSSLYYSTRNSIEDNFEGSNEIQLLGDIIGQLNAPSLTSDLNTLFIRYFDNDFETNIITLNRTAENEFTLVGNLQFPDGYIPGPGSISSNNLKYYFSMSDEANLNSKLYLFERQSIEEPFEILYRLESDSLDIQEVSFRHPSVSSNSNHIAFVRNNGNSWCENDLYIAQTSSLSIGDQITIQKPIIKNYPNPFNPTTTIEFTITSSGQVDVSVFNVKGQRVKTLINDSLISGNYQAVWNGVNEKNEYVSSGLYLYKLKVNGKIEAVNKCLLLK